jgi:hypothetical protein
MNLFDQLLMQMEHWLDRLDRERDVAMLMMQRDKSRQAEIEIWLLKLDDERATHCELLERFKAIRRANHPALVLERRPKPTMLRAKYLKTTPVVRKQA